MKKQMKQNLVIHTFEKQFKSFKEMIHEFKTLHPELSVIFAYDDEVVYPYDAARDVMEYFIDNSPNISTGDNLPVAVSVSSNKVSLKTSKFFTIKWQFKYDKKSGEISDIVGNVIVFAKEKNDKNIDEMMITLESTNNGWILLKK